LDAAFDFAKETAMGIYEENLRANQQYAEHFHLGHLPMPVAKKLARMDARLTVEQVLPVSEPAMLTSSAMPADS